MAHAIVLSSSPQRRERVAGPNLNVLVRFNSRVDAARSRLQLVRPDGAEISLSTLPGGAPDQLEARAEGLAPGEYRLLWRTLSLDGHIAKGEIPFEVGR